MLLSDVCLTSDVCLSVAYIGNNSRTVRPRKTTGSPRHTWLGYHFQGQKVTGAGHIVAASRLQLVIAEKAIMFTLRAKLYCNRPCLFVCLFVGPTYKLLQPARSVCVASERVFHFICACLSICPLTQKLLTKSLWNFMEWLDVILGPIDWTLSDLDPMSRSLEVKKSKSFLRMTPFKTA